MTSKKLLIIAFIVLMVWTLLNIDMDLVYAANVTYSINISVSMQVDQKHAPPPNAIEFNVSVESDKLHAPPPNAIEFFIKYLLCQTIQSICYEYNIYIPPPDSGGGSNSSSNGSWGGPGGSGDFPPVVWNTVLDVGYLVILVGISFLPVLVFGRRGLGGTLVLLALYSEAGLIDSWIVALAAILLLALIFIEVRGGGEGGG